MHELAGTLAACPIQSTVNVVPSSGSFPSGEQLPTSIPRGLPPFGFAMSYEGLIYGVAKDDFETAEIRVQRTGDTGVPVIESDCGTAIAVCRYEVGLKPVLRQSSDDDVVGGALHLRCGAYGATVSSEGPGNVPASANVRGYAFLGTLASGAAVPAAEAGRKR